MLKIKSSTRLPPTRTKNINGSVNGAAEKGPIIISCRSLRTSNNVPTPNSNDLYNTYDLNHTVSQDNGTDVEYNPIDLSIACSSKMVTRIASTNTSTAKLSPNRTMSLLPQIWHLCDLCDDTFSSKFALLEHFRKIHRIQRFQPREKSPEIEVIPINLPGNGSPEKKSPTTDIIYHPPAVTIRRMSSSSSGSSNQEHYLHSQPTHSSILFNQFELLSEVCRVCSASFSDKRSLMSHMKATHPMESRFGCSICSKVLSSRAALIGHMRIHTGEKPHVCNICNRAFSNSQTLTRHFRTHTKEKPYECPICGKRASLRHNMKLHIKIHEKQMMFVEPGRS